MPPSFPGFCESMSFIFVFLEISHFLYLVMFLLYTIIQFRFTLRKSKGFFIIRTEKNIMERVKCNPFYDIPHYYFYLLFPRINWVKLLWYLLNDSCRKAKLELNHALGKHRLFFSLRSHWHIYSCLL